MFLVQSVRKPVAVAFFWFLLLCLAPLQTLLAAEYHGDITTKKTLLIGDINRGSDITLASLNTRATNTQTGNEKVAFGLIWMQDTSGWLPMWRLFLKSDIGLIPAELSAPTKNAVAQISSITPVQGHTYETSLSYSRLLNVLSIRVADVSAEQVLYSGSFNVPTYNGALYAPDGSEAPYYLPVGFTWDIGAHEPNGAFIAQRFFATRKTEAFIRLNVPPSLPSSHYKVTLIRGNKETPLVMVSPQPGENWIPLKLADIPLGQSTLRLDYVQDNNTLLSEAKQIMAGRLEFAMQPVEVDRKAGTLHTILKVTSAEALAEKITVTVTATISELVWNKDQSVHSQVPYTTQTIYSGPLDLTNGATEIAVNLPLPSRPGNWQLSYAPKCELGISTLVSGKDRLFSTHIPATLKNNESYSFVVFPDAHVEPPDYAKMLTRMTGWVAENAAKFNIAGVFQVGDVTSHNMPEEWEQAQEAMGLLNGVVPYMLALGNHDIVKEKERSTIVSTGLDKAFSIEAASKYSNLVGTMSPGNLHNYYSLITVGETDYLVIVLEYAPTDAILDWASSVAQQYPNSKAIYVTHSYLTRFGTVANYPTDAEVGSLANTGVEIWQKLVSKHANSYMVISGHVWPSKPTVPHRIPRGDAGQQIYELLFDYQNQPRIGNGWFGLLTFQPDHTLEVRVYSPYLDEYSDTRDESGYNSHLFIKQN